MMNTNFHWISNKSRIFSFVVIIHLELNIICTIYIEECKEYAYTGIKCINSLFQVPLIHTTWPTVIIFKQWPLLHFVVMFTSKFVHYKICNDCHCTKVVSIVAHISITSFTIETFTTELLYLFVQPKGIIQWCRNATINVCHNTHYSCVVKVITLTSYSYQVVIFIGYKLKSSHILQRV